MPLFRRPVAQDQALSQVRALVASAREIKIGDPREITRRYEERQPWQQEAWDYFDLIGEAKYAILWQGNAMSKLRLFPAYQENPADDPEPVDESANPTAKLATEALDRLRSPLGDHSEILRMSAINMAVAGECYLVGLTPARGAEDEGESWYIKSVDEIRNDGGNFTIVEGKTRMRKITRDDFILRMWQSHPRFSNLADSNMRGVLSTCRAIILLELADRSEARNRAALAGILKVPQELSFGPTNPTSGKEEEEDPFIAELIETLTAPLTDEGSAAAMMPLVVRGAAEYLRELQHIPLDRPLDRWFDQRLERSLRRLAQGLNVPVEVVLGVSDVNHWNAWQIQEEAFKSHIEPQAIQIVEALTVGYLRRRLTAAGVAPDEADKYVIWYDPTQLVVRPDRTNDAIAAYDRITIADAPFLEILGLAPEDKPSPEEMLLRILLKLGPAAVPVAAALLGVELPEGAVPAAPGMPGMPPGAPATPLPPDGSGGPAPAGEPPSPGESGPPTLEPPPTLGPPPLMDGPSNGQPVPQLASVVVHNAGDPRVSASALAAAARIRTRKKNLGKRLGGLDNDLRARVGAIVESDLRRALKKVGAQVRQKVKKDKALTASLSRVPQHEVVAQIGKDGLLAAGIEMEELLDDAFEETSERFERQTQRAQDAALNAIFARLTGKGKAEDVRIALAEQRKVARDWFDDAMQEVAMERLYDPGVDWSGDYGEIDDTSVVPFSLTRTALAIAGGAALAAGWNFLTSLADEDVADGAAYGPIIRAALLDEGIGTQGFAWTYGAYPRTPFQPHEDLDGEFFSTFQDEVLRNYEPWPPVDFYVPGDHVYCRCGVEPYMGE